MESKIIFFFLASFSIMVWSCGAFNVTTMLDKYPNFNNFNQYLTETHLAGEINSRGTVTVLAVDNGGMGALSGKSKDVIKSVMAVHIVLDYYDVKKFTTLEKKTTRLTTLFQSTGMASGDQGFLNATDTGGKTVMIGSAVKNAPQGSNLVSAVAHEGYDISILQISSLIIPPGVESIAPKAAPPSHQQHGKSPAAAPSPRKLLSPSNSPSDSPSALTPSGVAPAATETDSPASGPNGESDSSATTALEACLGFVMAIISANLFFFML
ncbi:PREDICTED: fasciclin-like arabinogalactan protein 14 [Ipomoea nil]|uniref:fasciclin-like arabinogalactan protein 14 n=1 Tax=Ipomoea nil TaxID=35883 RepID=UPI000901E275|nr:PREDICTED: fasciclin-like arabinogalactan protein 14 [Ipomoea nil]